MVPPAETCGARAEDRPGAGCAAIYEENGQEHCHAGLALREQIYHGLHVDQAPDLLVGCASKYRAS